MLLGTVSWERFSPQPQHWTLQQIVRLSLPARWPGRNGVLLKCAPRNHLLVPEDFLFGQPPRQVINATSLQFLSLLPPALSCPPIHVHGEDAF
jgi:hypothetical protein